MDKLKKENKKLKEDNEKAALIMVEFERFIKKEKEENKKLQKQIEVSNDCALTACADYEKLVDKHNNDNLNFADIINDLEIANKELKVAMIKHTQQNYDEWKKETESDAIKLIRLDLERAEEENKKLKEENDKLSKSMYDLTMSFSHTTSDAETFLIKLTAETDKLQKKYDKLDSDNKDLRKQYQEEFQKQEYNISVKEENEELKSIGKDNDDGNYQDIIDDLEEEIKDLKEVVDDKKLLMVSDGLGGVVNVSQVMKQMDICRFVKEENDELKEEIKKWRDTETLEEEIKDLKEEIKELKENNKKIPELFKEKISEIKEQKDKQIKELIDKIECMKSNSDTSDEEYEGELKEKEAIVKYLSNQLDKYKILFDTSKAENNKVKDVKGMVVNEDNTIITINGVELKIGDKFYATGYTTAGGMKAELILFTLIEIYIGKTGKYSLRTTNDKSKEVGKITIRIGNSYITGKDKVWKKK